MARNKMWICRIRGYGLFGVLGRNTYWDVTQGQPLLLEREPGNPIDPNAIVVADLMGTSFCYVERKAAAEIAPLMDVGKVPTAKVMFMPKLVDEKIVHARVSVWFDGSEEITTTDNEMEKELSYE